MSQFTLPLDEADRQAVVMALAHLSRRRLGWNDYLRGIALRISDLEMYEDFRSFDAADYRLDGPAIQARDGDVDNGEDGL